MSNMEHFGERVRRIRSERGLTQQHLADAVGVSGQSLVGMWERGKALPSLSRLRDLASALGVTADELISNADLTIQPR